MKKGGAQAQRQAQKTLQFWVSIGRAVVDDSDHAMRRETFSTLMNPMDSYLI